jgi:hypothetical protein
VSAGFYPQSRTNSALSETYSSLGPFLVDFYYVIITFLLLLLVFLLLFSCQ